MNDHLLDYAQNSPHRGEIKNPTHKAERENVSCGDSISISLKVKDGVIKEARFIGTGCTISQAAASLLCEYAKNKKLTLLKKMAASDMIELVGIPLGPVRARCALLALEALHASISKEN